MLANVFRRSTCRIKWNSLLQSWISLTGERPSKDIQLFGWRTIEQQNILYQYVARVTMYLLITKTTENFLHKHSGSPHFDNYGGKLLCLLMWSDRKHTQCHWYINCPKMFNHKKTINKSEFWNSRIMTTPVHWCIHSTIIYWASSMCQLWSRHRALQEGHISSQHLTVYFEIFDRVKGW